MTLSFKLTAFREYRNLKHDEVAKQLGISPESYKDLEKGKVNVDGILAQKLSDLYHAPIEFFIIDDAPHYLQAEIIYTNCTFSNGSGGYINHQYNDRGIDEIIYAKKEEIKTLKQQIEQLIQQNNKLINLLVEKNKEAS